MNTNTNGLIEIIWDGITAQITPHDYDILGAIEAGITVRGECWEAAGYVNPTSHYVHLSARNQHRIRYVHRFVAFFFCALPLNYRTHQCHHLCGNKICCRPTHLQPLTVAEHHAVTLAEGCYLSGDRAPWSILTDAQVPSLRDRYRAGESCSAMADEIGVERTALYNALIGKTFKHLPGAVRDVRKRRDWSGQNCNLTKLTEAQAIAVFALYWEGDMNTVELCERYGVKNETVRSIVQGQSWAAATDGLKIQVRRIEVSKGKYKVINNPVPSSSLA